MMSTLVARLLTALWIMLGIIHHVGVHCAEKHICLCTTIGGISVSIIKGLKKITLIVILPAFTMAIRNWQCFDRARLSRYVHYG